MTYRPDLAHLPEGEVRELDGQPMRHVGDGRFVAVGEPMLKRFGVGDQEQPLHRVA